MPHVLSRWMIEVIEIRPGAIFVNCLISEAQFDVTVIPKRPIRSKKSVFSGVASDRSFRDGNVQWIRRWPNLVRSQ
jgi:hypothetical protein